jgi:hypothetical protein
MQSRSLLNIAAGSRQTSPATPRRVGSLALVFGLLLALPLASGCEDDGKMVVTGINPPAGHIAGEQTVQIAGKHFRTDIGYVVYFGNAKASAVSIKSTEMLIVTTPQHEAGAVDVTVRADDGNAFLMKQAFKYEDMGGSVVEGLGENAAKKSGNLAF